MSTLHWKISRDPFLGPLARRSADGEALALAAGFFFDEDEADSPLDDVDWLTTPWPRLRHRRRGGDPIVLLATGGFCPVHAGHIEMMERARRAAEGEGFDVLGGYLSPGHDDYLTLKCGDGAIPASTRLRQCAEVAARTDWLSVDPWEALHRRVSVNYTDVTWRLRQYLRAHVDERIDVFFVCGGDNARFASAFVEDGGCVVVGRPCAETELASWRARLDGHPRILWTDGSHVGASREIRAPRWVDDRKRRLVVRVEDVRAVRTLGVGAEAFDRFQRALLAVLAEASEVRTVSAPPADALKPSGALPTISLDAMRDADHSLAVSRLYGLGGYQLLDYVARPLAPSIEEQVGCLPRRGTVCLLEDDRMTGGTLAFVRRCLPPDLHVARTVLTIESHAEEDVIDSRDFLLGADDGGLVVELADGAVGRAPYLLPYVDPSVRASVSRARELSRRVWALNEELYRKTQLEVRHLPAPARAIMTRAASPSTPLAEVCRWHVSRIDALTPHS